MSTPQLHKKMAKGLKSLMIVGLISYLGHMSGIDQRFTCGSGLFYAIFSTPILYYFGESRRDPNPALARVRSKVLRLHPCRLDFGALRLLQQWGQPQCCIKKMEKTSPNVMGIEFSANPGLVTGKNQWCIPGSVRFFSIFLALRAPR
jgi:hypothetical protein